MTWVGRIIGEAVSLIHYNPVNIAATPTASSPFSPSNGSSTQYIPPPIPQKPSSEALDLFKKNLANFKSTPASGNR